jgi:organic radical activating enzyme
MTENRFHKYKQRMIDPVSDSFCAAKWYNATIWLNSGETTSCHHPPSHRIDVEEIKTNPSAIHNTQHKKQMRKMMLDGERPQECNYCWKVEDFKRNNVSDRVYKTIIYKDEDVEEIANLPWDANVTPKTLEIAFSRACNFACSYCSPAFSTSWVNDIKVNGDYTKLNDDGGRHYATKAEWAERGGKKEDENPYIQAFWKWWESDLSKNLEELRVTGGDPLMHPSVWKLMDWFADHQDSEVRLAVNSNMVPEKQSVITRLINASQNIKNFEIYTSNESVGAQSEYIRDGINYDLWMSNLKQVIEQGNIKRIHMMMTINSLCLESITEFMDEMIVLRKLYGKKSPTMSLNILRFPDFQAITAMPPELRFIFRDKISHWLDDEKRAVLHDNEIDQILRVIDYLEVIGENDNNTDSFPLSFTSFYKQYDVRRKKDFVLTFPTFAPWFK